MTPYFFIYKLLRKKKNIMGLRGGNPKGTVAKIFARFLFFWFKFIENNINFGFGLSAIIVADKPDS